MSNLYVPNALDIVGVIPGVPGALEHPGRIGEHTPAVVLAPDPWHLAPPEAEEQSERKRSCHVLCHVAPNFLGRYVTPAVSAPPVQVPRFSRRGTLAGVFN